MKKNDITQPSSADILVNRVANSSIVTINLEEFFPSESLLLFDLKDHLFQGLILKEKDFRKTLKEWDWSQYEGHIVCVSCSSDAIIPVWAFMLVTSYLSLRDIDSYVGSQDDYISHHYENTIGSMDLSSYDQKRVVIKGCSNQPVPPSAYAALTSQLQPFALSIMYGEPCSTVPIYKKPRKKI